MTFDALEARIAVLEERLAQRQVPDIRADLLRVLERDLVLTPEMVGGDIREEFLRLNSGSTEREVFVGTGSAVFVASPTTVATVAHNTGRGFAFAVPAMDPTGTGELGFAYGARPAAADPANVVEFTFRSGSGVALNLTVPYYYLVLT